MKKVSEVAKQLEVSRQTIYNHIGKLDDDIAKHIYRQEGVKVIDGQGIKLIKRSIGRQKGFKKSTEEFDSQEGDNQQQGEKEALQGHIKSLKEEIDRLESELQEKNKQLERKDKQLENFQVMLQRRENEVYELEGKVQQNSKSIISRIKDFFS